MRVSALLRGVDGRPSGTDHPVVRGALRCESMMGPSVIFMLASRIEISRAARMPLRHRSMSLASCREFSYAAMTRSRRSAEIPPYHRGGDSGPCPSAGPECR